MIEKLKEFQRVVIFRFLDENGLTPLGHREYTREELANAMAALLGRPPTPEEVAYIAD